MRSPSEFAFLQSAAVLGMLASCCLPISGVAASGPPIFTQLPADRVAYEGEQVTFDALADGTQPIAFQWFKNGGAITGANGPTFVLPRIGPSDDQSVFFVKASNALGQITSSNITLTVKRGIIVAAAVNGTTELLIPGGWPFLLDVGLLHPELFDSNAVPILICASNGPWSNAIEIQVVDSHRQIQNWPLHADAITNESLLLSEDRRGQLSWWLAPEQTAQLTNGRYTLTATLNTTNTVNPLAWRGLIKSVPVIITITNEPAVLTEADAEEKHRRFAQYFLIQHDEAQARQEVAALLTAYPTNIGGLTMNMYLQRRAGLLVDALQTIEEALAEVHVQYPHAPEPPLELLQNLDELQLLLAPPTLKLTLAAGQLTLQWDGHPDTTYKLETSQD